MVWTRGRAPDGAARVWAVPSSELGAERLARYFGLRELLGADWAAQPLELDPPGLPAGSLLLDDPGGEPLSEYTGKLDLKACLQVTLALARALDELHLAGLLHRDLKPSHVLVDFARQRAWLLGFGIAAPAMPDSPTRVEGTLAYMAPEQGARTGGAIGPSSDLYAVGIILYELLTGSPPFHAEDARGYLHLHSATLPAPLAEVPAGLADVVSKLLEKDPALRYPSAASLVRDLRRCLASWDASGTVARFPLAAGVEPAQDVLYGRASLLDELVARAEHALHGTGAGLLCLAGPSGIGKTALVHALRRRLAGALFASGKFDQQAINSPYASFAQAFRGLVRAALARSDAELERLRGELAVALRGHGDRLVGLVPELTSLLGPLPAVHDLTPLDAQNRFQSSVRGLLSVFARAERPLLLFLDDLHAADPATLQLFEHLIGHPQLPHVLLIGAYRDGEPGAALRAREVRVPPLSEPGLRELVEARLQVDAERARPLAQLLLQKTAGNPFHASQLLRALVEQQREDSWRIPDLDLPEGVLELLLQRLAALPEDARELVRLLSCLGQDASLDVLEIAADGPVRARLEPAVEAGLLLARDGGYAFVHDRIQEAAYDSVPEREAQHFRIGMRLAEQLPGARREELLFAIVHQLERGLAHAEERHHAPIAQLALAAGQRAKAASAHASALAFFTRGDELAASLSWEQHHELRFELGLQRAECEVMTGAPQVAERRLAALSQRARDPATKARVTCLHSALYTTLGQPDRSVEICLAYLRGAGFAWDVRPSQADVDREFARMRSTIGDTPIEQLVELPTMHDPAWIAVMDVLGDLLAPAFFSDRALFALVVAGAINTTLEHGNSHGGALAYMTLGAALTTHLHDSQAGYRFGKLGYALATERGFDRYLARIEMFYGLSISPWGRPIREGRAVVQRTTAMLEATDVTYTLYIRHLLVSHMLIAGDPLARVESDIEGHLAVAREAQFGLAIVILETQRGLVRTLRGTTEALGSFDDHDFEEQALEARFAADARLSIAAVWYWIRKIQAHFHAGQHELAVSAAARAEPLMWIAGIGTVEHADFHLFAALSRARVGLLDDVARHLAQLAAWAGPCPWNFAHLEALVGAELARARGEDARAMELYERALQGAREHGFVHHEAIAAELAAEFYRARGLSTVVDAYLRRAAESYLEWGALAKLEQLRRAQPALASVVPRADEGTFGASRQALDMATVLQASRSLSSEIVLERLIATLLSLALEHAGAEHGVLLLMRDGELRAVASGRVGAEVELCDASVAEARLVASALHLVVRLQVPLLLDDARADEAHAADPQVRERGVRSLLLVPIREQARMIGVLYCENNLAPRAFSGSSSAVLELLAAQAAISLENARLYRELEQENAQRQRALEERGELLREVHHRVKNNLQLISSLLSLQAKRAQPEVAELFADLRSRVRSMASAHEHLYRASNLADVAMLPHLRNVCAQLMRAYPGRGVELTVQGADLSLPLAQAIPCGLIVNELVSNALKHAFRGRASGTIRVELSASDRLCLEVADDGVGAAAAHAEALGLQLVRDLTRQLGGDVELRSEQGTRVAVRFGSSGAGA